MNIAELLHIDERDTQEYNQIQLCLDAFQYIESDQWQCEANCVNGYAGQTTNVHHQPKQQHKQLDTPLSYQLRRVNTDTLIDTGTDLSWEKAEFPFIQPVATVKANALQLEPRQCYSDSKATPKVTHPSLLHRSSSQTSPNNQTDEFCPFQVHNKRKKNGRRCSQSGPCTPNASIPKEVTGHPSTPVGHTMHEITTLGQCSVSQDQCKQKGVAQREGISDAQAQLDPLSIVDIVMLKRRCDKKSAQRKSGRLQGRHSKTSNRHYSDFQCSSPLQLQYNETLVSVKVQYKITGSDDTPGFNRYTTPRCTSLELVANYNCRNSEGNGGKVGLETTVVSADHVNACETATAVGAAQLNVELKGVAADGAPLDSQDLLQGSDRHCPNYYIDSVVVEDSEVIPDSQANVDDYPLQPTAMDSKLAENGKEQGTVGHQTTDNSTSNNHSQIVVSNSQPMPNTNAPHQTRSCQDVRNQRSKQAADSQPHSITSVRSDSKLAYNSPPSATRKQTQGSSAWTHPLLHASNDQTDSVNGKHAKHVHSPSSCVKPKALLHVFEQSCDDHEQEAQHEHPATSQQPFEQQDQQHSEGGETDVVSGLGCTQAGAKVAGDVADDVCKVGCIVGMSDVVPDTPMNNGAGYLQQQKQDSGVVSEGEVEAISKAQSSPIARKLSSEQAQECEELAQFGRAKASELVGVNDGDKDAARCFSSECFALQSVEKGEGCIIIQRDLGVILDTPSDVVQSADAVVRSPLNTPTEQTFSTVSKSVVSEVDEAKGCPRKEYQPTNTMPTYPQGEGCVGKVQSFDQLFGDADNKLEATPVASINQSPQMMSNISTCTPLNVQHTVTNDRVALKSTSVNVHKSTQLDHSASSSSANDKANVFLFETASGKQEVVEGKGLSFADNFVQQLYNDENCPPANQVANQGANQVANQGTQLIKRGPAPGVAPLLNATPPHYYNNQRRSQNYQNYYGPQQQNNYNTVRTGRGGSATRATIYGDHTRKLGVGLKARGTPNARGMHHGDYRGTHAAMQFGRGVTRGASVNRVGQRTGRGGFYGGRGLGGLGGRGLANGRMGDGGVPGRHGFTWTHQSVRRNGYDKNMNMQTQQGLGNVMQRGEQPVSYQDTKGNNGGAYQRHEQLAQDQGVGAMGNDSLFYSASGQQQQVCHSSSSSKVARAAAIISEMFDLDQHEAAVSAAPVKFQQQNDRGGRGEAQWSGVRGSSSKKGGESGSWGGQLGAGLSGVGAEQGMDHCKNVGSGLVKDNSNSVASMRYEQTRAAYGVQQRKTQQTAGLHAHSQKHVLDLYSDQVSMSPLTSGLNTSHRPVENQVSERSNEISVSNQSDKFKQTFDNQVEKSDNQVEQTDDPNQSTFSFPTNLGNHLDLDIQCTPVISPPKQNIPQTKPENQAVSNHHKHVQDQPFCVVVNPMSPADSSIQCSLNISPTLRPLPTPPSSNALHQTTNATPCVTQSETTTPIAGVTTEIRTPLTSHCFDTSPASPVAQHSTEGVVQQRTDCAASNAFGSPLAQKRASGGAVGGVGCVVAIGGVAGAHEDDAPGVAAGITEAEQVKGGVRQWGVEEQLRGQQVVQGDLGVDGGRDVQQDAHQDVHQDVHSSSVGFTFTTASGTHLVVDQSLVDQQSRLFSDIDVQGDESMGIPSVAQQHTAGNADAKGSARGVEWAQQGTVQNQGTKQSVQGLSIADEVGVSSGARRCDTASEKSSNLQQLLASFGAAQANTGVRGVQLVSQGQQQNYSKQQLSKMDDFFKDADAQAMQQQDRSSDDKTQQTGAKSNEEPNPMPGQVIHNAYCAQKAAPNNQQGEQGILGVATGTTQTPQAYQPQQPYQSQKAQQPQQPQQPWQAQQAFQPQQPQQPRQRQNPSTLAPVNSSMCTSGSDKGSACNSSGADYRIPQITKPRAQAFKQIPAGTKQTDRVNMKRGFTPPLQANKKLKIGTKHTNVLPGNYNAVGGAQGGSTLEGQEGVQTPQKSSVLPVHDLYRTQNRVTLRQAAVKCAKGKKAKVLGVECVASRCVQRIGGVMDDLWNLTLDMDITYCILSPTSLLMNLNRIYVAKVIQVIQREWTGVTVGELCEQLQLVATEHGHKKDTVQPAWVLNHFRNIFWKLLSRAIAQACPMQDKTMQNNKLAKPFRTPLLATKPNETGEANVNAKTPSTPQCSSSLYSECAVSRERVMEQLRYRLEREQGQGHRTCLARVLEQDTPSAVPMNLIVCRIVKAQAGGDVQGFQFVLSDGWYFVKCVPDEGLQALVAKGALHVGRKLRITNAKLIANAPAPPLEAFGSCYLKVCANKTHPLSEYETLGLSSSNRLRYVSARAVHPMGGPSGKLLCTVLRVWPVQMWEGNEGGGGGFKWREAGWQRVVNLRQEENDSVHEQVWSQVRNEEYQFCQNICQQVAIGSLPLNHPSARYAARVVEPNHDSQQTCGSALPMQSNNNEEIAVVRYAQARQDQMNSRVQTIIQQHGSGNQQQQKQIGVPCLREATPVLHIVLQSAHPPHQHTQPNAQPPRLIVARVYNPSEELCASTTGDVVAVVGLQNKGTFEFTQGTFNVDKTACGFFEQNQPPALFVSTPKISQWLMLPRASVCSSLFGTLCAPHVLRPGPFAAGARAGHVVDVLGWVCDVSMLQDQLNGSRDTQCVVFGYVLNDKGGGLKVVGRESANNGSVGYWVVVVTDGVTGCMEMVPKSCQGARCVFMDVVVRRVDHYNKMVLCYSQPLSRCSTTVGGGQAASGGVGQFDWGTGGVDQLNSIKGIMKNCVICQ